MNMYRKMQRVINKYGWTTGDFARIDYYTADAPVGGVCLMGAYGCARGIDIYEVNECMDGPFRSSPTIVHLAEFIIELYPDLRNHLFDDDLTNDPARVITVWNDRCAHDKDEVLNILDKLACELEAKV